MHRLTIRDTNTHQAVAAAVKAVSAADLAAHSTAIATRLLALPVVRSCPRFAVYLTMPDEVDTQPIWTRCLAEGKSVYVPKVMGPGATDMRMARVDSADQVRAFAPSAWGIPEPSDAEVAAAEDMLLGRPVPLDEHPDPFGDEYDPDAVGSDADGAGTGAGAGAGTATPEVRADAAAAHTVSGIVIVPGAAFDAHGHRLGRGRGYYDCFLRRINRLWPERGLTPPVTIAIALDEQVLDTVPVDTHDRPVDIVVTPTRVLTRPANKHS